MIIEKTTGSPVVTNDGVTIAPEIHLRNQVENMGAQLEKAAHPAAREEDYARVAAISANDDDAVGAVIARALATVGEGGVVTVEESPRDPRPLVLIAETVEGGALSMLVHNHVNGVFQAVAVRAPRLRRPPISVISAGFHPVPSALRRSASPWCAPTSA